jgi:membrane-associated phospholipid phosphatase
MMLDILRRRLDELVSGLFLLLVAVLTVLDPPVFATPGGRVLTRIALWSAAVLVAALFIAARFSSRARRQLHLVLEFAPIIVAMAGYVGLKLLHAHAVTTWLGIPSFDHWAIEADDAIFGKTPYLWFSRGPLGSILFLRIMSGFYVFYAFTPILALAWFRFRRDTMQFRLVQRALIVSFYCGYCCYLLIPVAGPLSLAQTAAPNFLDSTRAYSFLADNFRYAYDCFPSLHTATPWLIVWLSRGRLPRWLMAAAIVAACGITLSTIALEVHYGIDVIAGLAWVFLIWPLARATLPREQGS